MMQEHRHWRCEACGQEIFMQAARSAAFCRICAPVAFGVKVGKITNVISPNEMSTLIPRKFKTEAEKVLPLQRTFNRKHLEGKFCQWAPSSTRRPLLSSGKCKALNCRLGGVWGIHWPVRTE